MRAVRFRQTQQEKEQGDSAFRRQKKPPVLNALQIFQQEQRNRGPQQHADGLAGNRGDHHSRPTAFRQNFRDVAAADWEIDSDSYPDKKLADKKHHRSVRQRTGRCARGNNYHVGKHQPLAAKTIGHRSTDASPENSTQHQGRSDKPDYAGFDMKLSDDERHRHAENKNGEAIKQRAAGRKHPNPSLDGFQRRLIQE
jgi:hypothetical protein